MMGTTVAKKGRLLGDLRVHRRMQELTLDEVAQRMGTTFQTVSRLERGLQPMTVEWLFDYCSAIGVEIDVFVYERGQCTPKEG